MDRLYCQPMRTNHGVLSAVALTLARVAPGLPQPNDVLEEVNKATVPKAGDPLASVRGPCTMRFSARTHGDARACPLPGESQSCEFILRVAAYSSSSPWSAHCRARLEALLAANAPARPGPSAPSGLRLSLGHCARSSLKGMILSLPDAKLGVHDVLLLEMPARNARESDDVDDVVYQYSREARTRPHPPPHLLPSSPSETRIVVPGVEGTDAHAARRVHDNGWPDSSCDHTR